MRGIGRILYSIGVALGGGPMVMNSIVPCGGIGLSEASSVLLDKIEEIGDTHAEIYLPDAELKIYRKDEVAEAYLLAEVSKIEYIAEKMDCDDFAAMAYGKFLGLVWTNTHALNWFIDEDETFWFVEPQKALLARDLEGWQGNNIRFFIGR